MYHDGVLICIQILAVQFFTIHPILILDHIQCMWSCRWKGVILSNLSLKFVLLEKG